MVVPTRLGGVGLASDNTSTGRVSGAGAGRLYTYRDNATPRTATATTAQLEPHTTPHKQHPARARSYAHSSVNQILRNLPKPAYQQHMYSTHTHAPGDQVVTTAVCTDGPQPIGCNEAAPASRHSTRARYVSP